VSVAIIVASLIRRAAKVNVPDGWHKSKVFWFLFSKNNMLPY
jgi:hypothetical protein